MTLKKSCGPNILPTGTGPMPKDELDDYISWWTEYAGDVVIIAEEDWLGNEDQVGDNTWDYIFDRFDYTFDFKRPWAESVSGNYWGVSYLFLNGFNTPELCSG